MLRIKDIVKQNTKIVRDAIINAPFGTQKTLAKMVGITTMSVSRFKKGRPGKNNTVDDLMDALIELKLL